MKTLSQLHRKVNYTERWGPGIFYSILEGLKYSILHNVNYSTRDNLESLVDFLDWSRDLCGWKIP